MMFIARCLVALTLIMMLPSYAEAQSTLLQAGPVTPGHAPMYLNSGSSQAVGQDSGPAAGGSPGVGLSELGLTARGTGTPPYIGQGTGPNGENFCDNDAPITNATGYHYLCLSANAHGGGLIAYGAVGSAPQLPLFIDLNGTAYQLPFAVGGIVGPTTSVVNDVVCWNNTTGNLASDCGPRYGIADGLTATGSNQGTAFQIAKPTNAFGTVASNTGSILPTTDTLGNPIAVGYQVVVLNSGANSLSTYPPSGQSINGGSVNAAVSIFPNDAATFVYRGTGAWYAL